MITGATYGLLGVYLGTKLVKTIDEHSATAAHKTITVYSSSERKRRTFTFAALQNKRVTVDGFNVGY